MNNYEALYIINPKLDGEAVKAVIEKFSALVTENGGVVDGIEEQGVKKLAYEINFMNEGFYVLMNVTCTKDAQSELDRFMRNDENVVRQMIIKK